MNNFFFSRTRFYFTGIVTIALWLLLVWNHYHGGVQSHHILNRKDFPAISNWWGGLLLPILTWFLLYRIQNRIMREYVEKSKVTKLPISIFYGFTGALFFGILLSVFFTFGYSNILGYMVLGLILIAFFFPIYRAECMLGLIIGLTYTFGVVLPAGVGSLLVLLCAVIYLFIRPLILYIATKLLHLLSSNKQQPNK